MSEETEDVMAQTTRLADDARALVRRLRESGLVPKEAIPGWVGGAIVTAVVEELSE